MKILIVCSGNKRRISPFISEQVEAIKKYDLEIKYFLIRGRGIKGYVKNIFELRKYLKSEKPDIIHAHYGLSGFICVFQRITPFVVTFHGSDVNIRKNLFISKIVMFFAKFNIFVSEELIKKSKLKTGQVIPCGVNLNEFKKLDVKVCREKFNFKSDTIYILFSSNFNNINKNYPLAKEAVELMQKCGKEVEVIEFINFNREDVPFLFNAVDLALLTSFKEGSPQFVKEALACGCPVVSTDVGDVKSNFSNFKTCFISSFDAKDIAYNIDKAIAIDKSKIENNVDDYDNVLIAKKIIDIYTKVI